VHYALYLNFPEQDHDVSVEMFTAGDLQVFAEKDLIL